MMPRSTWTIEVDGTRWRAPKPVCLEFLRLKEKAQAIISLAEEIYGCQERECEDCKETWQEILKHKESLDDSSRV